MFGKEKNEEYIACQNCGAITRKTKLKKCKHCGVVLCPKCRRKHKCSNVLYIRRGLHTGPTMDRGNSHQNPQCNIKISDMRIYEIARAPETMTDYERYLVLNDPDVRRRYLQYREEIESNGY